MPHAPREAVRSSATASTRQPVRRLDHTAEGPRGHRCVSVWNPAFAHSGKLDHTASSLRTLGYPPREAVHSSATTSLPTRATRRLSACPSAAATPPKRAAASAAASSSLSRHDCWMHVTALSVPADATRQPGTCRGHNHDYSYANGQIATKQRSMMQTRSPAPLMALNLCLMITTYDTHARPGASPRQGHTCNNGCPPNPFPLPPPLPLERPTRSPLPDVVPCKAPSLAPLLLPCPCPAPCLHTPVPAPAVPPCSRSSPARGPLPSSPAPAPGPLPCCPPLPSPPPLPSATRYPVLFSLPIALCPGPSLLPASYMAPCPAPLPCPLPPARALTHAPGLLLVSYPRLPPAPAPASDTAASAADISRAKDSVTTLCWHP